MTEGPVDMGDGRLSVVVQSVAKSGRQPDENEDSVAENLGERRFAVSDGASTSARSEVWSRLLADAFVGGGDPLASNTLAELRNQWWRLVFRPSLPWFAQEKLVQGGAATFVGLHIIGDTYQVMAVGDSCLFHIRKEEILLTGPLEHWDQFSRFPALVSTRHDTEALQDNLWEGGGAFQEGDVFVLATDAVAKHLLRVYEECGYLLPISDQAHSCEQFIEFIDSQRNLGLENDDATVCVVRT